VQQRSFIYHSLYSFFDTTVISHSSLFHSTTFTPPSDDKMFKVSHLELNIRLLMPPLATQSSRGQAFDQMDDGDFSMVPVQMDSGTVILYSTA
jgi:hypothetical protein